MKTIAALAAGLVLAAGAAQAQDALMNSAETINKDNFKFSGYPILGLGEGDDNGLGLRAGYGFSRGFDVEAKISFFDAVTYYGIDAEWWLHRKDPDFSFSLGVHRSSFDGGFEVMGLDTTGLVSKKVGRKLEVYTGLRIAWEFPDEGDSYRRMHIVPGIEYRISDDIDFLTELGLKLNDDSSSYLAVGLAYYIR